MTTKTKGTYYAGNNCIWHGVECGMKDCPEPCEEYRKINGPEWVCLNCDWTGQDCELAWKYPTVPDAEPYAVCPNCQSEDIDYYDTVVL